MDILPASQEIKYEILRTIQGHCCNFWCNIQSWDGNMGCRVKAWISGVCSGWSFPPISVLSICPTYQLLLPETNSQSNLRFLTLLTQEVTPLPHKVTPQNLLLLALSWITLTISRPQTPWTLVFYFCYRPLNYL